MLKEMKLYMRYVSLVVAILVIVALLKLHIVPGRNPAFYEEFEQGHAVLFRSYAKKDTMQAQVREKTRERIDLRKFYKINVKKSDVIPLNRIIPDTRPFQCSTIQWPGNLPLTSIVITYHNEWPSILLRTIYSVVNRTPKHLLKQIILVDDASIDPVTEEIREFLKRNPLDRNIEYIELEVRQGLIRARLEGFKHVTGDVVSFLDSHMEVNRDWLQPLLLEIMKNKKVLVMGHLDYINAKTMDYSFITDYRTRYGFDWRLHFFETYFRSDQTKNDSKTATLPGVVAVGSAFAIDVSYFKELGTYDEGMRIWGGENIELSLKVWLCGGRVLHVACSKVGHIARDQPYSFLDDRISVEMHNYKRIVEVWFDGYQKYVYDIYPKMETMDVGDLTPQLALRSRCKPFKWFLENVWPELLPYKDDVREWGMIETRMSATGAKVCLDNNKYLFSMPSRLISKPCSGDPTTQMMSLTYDNRLRTILQCVIVAQEDMDYVPYLRSCQGEGIISTWEADKGTLRNIETDTCLEITSNGLIMDECDGNKPEQNWKFTKPKTSTW